MGPIVTVGPISVTAIAATAASGPSRLRRRQPGLPQRSCLGDANSWRSFEQLDLECCLILRGHPDILSCRLSIQGQISACGRDSGRLWFGKTVGAGCIRLSPALPGMSLSVLCKRPIVNGAGTRSGRC